MDQLEEPAVALYDFLYRDSNRISSYYAQLFEGRLTLVEQADTERDLQDQNLKASALSVVSGEFKNTSEVQSARKRILDPHDLVTSEVLSYLIQENRVQQDIVSAPHGALVLVKGTVVFIDGALLSIGSLIFEAAIKEEKQKPKNKRDDNTIRTGEFIVKLLGQLTLPSCFFLNVSEEIQVGGTLKDTGMEEPISTYNLKHGTAGLAEVYLIGIKEMASSLLALPNTEFGAASQQFSQALSNLVFTPDSIRVTPIALFRKL